MDNIPEVLYIDIYKGIYKSKNKEIQEKTNNEKLKRTNVYYMSIINNKKEYTRNIYERLIIELLKNIDVDEIDMLRMSVCNEHYILMEYYYSKIKEKDKIDTKILIEYGIHNNNIRILEWIWNKKKIEFIYTKNVLDNIKNNEQVEILEWWIKKGLKIEYSKKRIDGIAFRGSKDILEWLYKRNYKIIYLWAIENATLGGNEEILEWFWNKKEELGFLYTDIWIGKNDIKILEWFKKNVPTNRIYYSESVINNAARDNKIHVLEWFWKNRCNGFKFKYSEEALISASEYGLIEVLDWFWIRRSEIKFKFEKGCINYALNTKVLDWFWDKRKEIEIEYDDVAIDNGDIEKIKWFWNKKKEYNLEFKYTNLIFICNKDNEDILDWLMKNNIKMKENEIEPYITN